MSGERILLINFNFFIVYLESHVTPRKRDISKTSEGRKFWMREREIVKLRVEDEVMAAFDETTEK